MERSKLKPEIIVCTHSGIPVPLMIKFCSWC